MTTFPTEVLDRLGHAKIVAGLSFDNVDDVAPVAEALLAGGVDAVELTLRTPASMDALHMLCRVAPEMLIGVGTVLSPDAAAEAKNAGAHFAVAPGLNKRVVRAAQEHGLPFAPGIATPSELDAAIELGCPLVKLFPAESLGGIQHLRAISAPYNHLGVQFFPFGGINVNNMVDYLNESNVLAVGGSWIVPKELVKDKDWAGIAAKAEQAKGRLPARTGHLQVAPSRIDSRNPARSPLEATARTGGV